MRVPRICRCQRDRPVGTNPGRGFSYGVGNPEDASINPNLEHNQHIEDWIEDIQRAEQKQTFQQNLQVQSKGGNVGLLEEQSSGMLDQEAFQFKRKANEGAILGKTPQGREPNILRPQIHDYGSSWGVKPPMDDFRHEHPKDIPQPFPDGPIFEDFEEPSSKPEGQLPIYSLPGKEEDLSVPKRHETAPGRTSNGYSGQPRENLLKAIPENLPRVWGTSNPRLPSQINQAFDSPLNRPSSNGGNLGDFQPNFPPETKKPNIQPGRPEKRGPHIRRPKLNSGWLSIQPKASSGFDPRRGPKIVGDFGPRKQPGASLSQDAEDSIDLKKRASTGQGSKFRWNDEDLESGRFEEQDEERFGDRRKNIVKERVESERQARLKHLREERRREADRKRKRTRKSASRKSSKSRASQSSSISRKNQFHASLGNGIGFESNTEHRSQKSAFAHELEEASEYESVYQDEIPDRELIPSRRNPFETRRKPVQMRTPPKSFGTRNPLKPRSIRRPIIVPSKRAPPPRPSIPRVQPQAGWLG